MEQINSLMLYEKWLMFTRGKIEPRVGDKIKRIFAYTDETYSIEDDIYQDFYQMDECYVEVPYPIVETTKIIQLKEDWVEGEIIVDVTECCKVGPITNENYCSKCGKKIIR